ncbi:MAG: HDOD domain-containing protein, partial [Planctomycetes bacterium]|nr:HDOD domain-containing protein [Planctomycetota bacterium]
MSLQIAVNETKAGSKLGGWLQANHRLPIQPTVFLKLMELGKSTDASPKNYADVIGSSPSLASRLLSAVNSAWFGVRYEITSIPQAVALLGTVNVRVLAIAHCLAAVYDEIQLPKETLEQYWKSHLLKAEAGRYMAEHIDASNSDEAFLVGLLQDMAIPVMHQFHPSLYEKTAWDQTIPPPQLSAMEIEVFGLDHGQASAIMAERLGIPDQLCVALRHHHDRSALAGGCDKEALAEATYFASLFPHVPVHWRDSATVEITELARQKLGASAGAIQSLLGEIQQRFIQLARFIRPA